MCIDLWGAKKAVQSRIIGVLCTRGDTGSPTKALGDDGFGSTKVWYLVELKLKLPTFDGHINVSEEGEQDEQIATDLHA